jgi:hypothetical protein
MSTVPTPPVIHTAVAEEPTVTITAARHAQVRSLLDVMEGRLDTVEAGVVNELRKLLDALTKEFEAKALVAFNAAQKAYTEQKAADLHKLRVLLDMNSGKEFD